MDAINVLYEPDSLRDALLYMAGNPGTIPLAGGTDVLVKLRKNRPEGVTLMSLNKLEALRGIAVRGDGAVEIGPLTTFTDLTESPVIASRCPALATAASVMGGPQIRNAATIGGNICNGAVSADSAPSLFAFEAELLLRSEGQERLVSIEDFYLGPGKVDRKDDELLTAIILPPHKARTGSAYIKFATRQAMDLAVLGVAACCTADDDKALEKVTIALGVAGPTPLRCRQAEAFLEGRLPDDAAYVKAGELALKDASPRDSWRASKRYREALIRELTGRAVREAYELACRS